MPNSRGCSTKLLYLVKLPATVNSTAYNFSEDPLPHRNDHGRDKAAFFFDMLDFSDHGEASYDEVAICISTVVGAMSKVR